MKVRLRQLEAFRAVAQTGSITGAAKSLGVSQPATSRLLKSFSDTIGFTLFERSGGRLRPSQEARYLLGEVGRLLDNLSHIEELAADLTARRAGHLRIACLPGFATSHLPRVLTEFLNARPGVTATLEPDRPERILEWIVGEQFDCGITDGFLGHPAVTSENVDMSTVCILPAGHRLSGRAEIWPEDLADEKMIHTRRDSAFFRRLETAFASRGQTISTWIETRQFTAACMLVAEGGGVSVVSEMDAREYAGKGLEIRPFLPQTPHRLTILRPLHTPSAMITLEFVEAFLESLRPYRLPDD